MNTAAPPPLSGPPTDPPQDPQPRRSPTATRLWLRLSLSLVITAAVLLLVSRQVDAIPDDLSVPLWAVPAYLATLVLYFLARAGRWWFLVRPLGAVQPLSLIHI